MKPVLLDVSQSERSQFIECIKPSAAQLAQLDRYAELLAEWNAKFNLISASTLPHVWNRHFLDSAQLFKFTPDTAKSLADMGSGAGFPGVVLSILGVPNVHLIDATGKKANFLREVIADLKLDAVVRQERVEEMRDLQVDIITARALAPMTELLSLANRLTKNDSLCLFLKGQSVDAELTESAKYWRFKSEKITSLSDPSGSVLILRNLKIKHVAPRKSKRKKK